MDLQGGLEFQAHLPIETILAMVIRSSGQPEGKKKINTTHKVPEL